MEDVDGGMLSDTSEYDVAVLAYARLVGSTPEFRECIRAMRNEVECSFSAVSMI